jgi:hypothetical protein
LKKGKIKYFSRLANLLSIPRLCLLDLFCFPWNDMTTSLSVGQQLSERFWATMEVNLQYHFLWPLDHFNFNFQWVPQSWFSLWTMKGLNHSNIISYIILCQKEEWTLEVRVFICPKMFHLYLKTMELFFIMLNCRYFFNFQEIEL